VICGENGHAAYVIASLYLGFDAGERKRSQLDVACLQSYALSAYPVYSTVFTSYFTV
jgi:hypothetical protein